MRFLLIFLLFPSISSYAIGANSFNKKSEPMPQAIMGVSTYLGHISNDNSEHAYYAGASLYVYFFNWSMEARSFPEDSFQRDNIIQPYVGLGLGRFLQIQRGVDFTSTTRFRILSEIAFDEFVDKRNHWTLQGFIEQIDTSSDNKKRYGFALGYTF